MERSRFLVETTWLIAHLQDTELLGYPSLTNYDGSWNEWGVRQDLPVEL